MKVSLVSCSGMNGWWGHTILNRREFQIHPSDFYGGGIQTALLHRCDLLVVEEMPGTKGLRRFLADLEELAPPPDFKVILLLSSTLSNVPGPPVSEVLKLPCTVKAFDEAVGRVLSLVPRSNVRHLIRFHLVMGRERAARDGRGVTMELSAAGMLVETESALAEGGVYLWTFTGVKELSHMAIRGKVIREADSTAGGRLHHFAVRFDPASKKELRILNAYLRRHV